MTKATKPPSPMRHIVLIGGKISDIVANLAAHPFAIAGMLVFCTIWFVVGGPDSENALTLALSVLAITLTQMVLNQQKRSEAALHLKIDELIIAMQGARNELAGIEGASHEEIEELRRTAKTGTED
ncbi:low affinity iron permease family protein [Sphingomonas sp. GlSt437]|uniref:low affinity iron permease family protein n=1 Tax=Sphingomonas sp. GlSt437 TaxID=3389970 RepID=UPI003A8537D3